MGGLRWSRRSTAALAAELSRSGLAVSARTVAARLSALGYSLRLNRKCIAHASHPDRDPQFQRIAALRLQCAAEGVPLISVDTKKKKLVGLFKNNGVAWSQHSPPVLDHDFPSLAEGIAIPYGIYDLLANRGTVFVGDSTDTPDFAVDCIETWLRTEGHARYPAAKRLVILADSGGSNGCRPRAWKYALQHVLCNRHLIRVTVAHYPTGCSQWNPIEQRLFSEISKNWSSRPLDSYETVLNYIRTTATQTGLRVGAERIREQYATGVKISKQQMRQLNLVPSTTSP